MNAEISETMGARLLRFGVQIPELLTHRKFVSVECHVHSNAHKPPKTVAPTILMVDRKFLLKCISLVNKKKIFATLTNLPRKKAMTSDPDNAKCFYACMCVYVNSCRPNLAAKKSPAGAQREQSARVTYSIE